jgi:putative ABC transport system permease protein
VLKATLKGVFAHKLRLALTALAVVLGVAFMAGTFILTDTMKASINGLIGRSSSGRSVIVRGVSQFQGSSLNSSRPGVALGPNARPLIPESVLAVVRAVPGVGLAEGTVQGQVSLVRPDGKAVRGSNSFAPTLAVAWVPHRSLSSLVLRSGRAPEKVGEMVIDQKSATTSKVAIGSKVIVTGNLGPQPYTVVGLVSFGTQGTLAGATFVAFDSATAQQVVGKPGYFTEIDVASAGGVQTDALVKAIGGRLPPQYEAISAAAATAQLAANFDSFVSIFNTLLLAFALIALFVGVFLIFNTFSILIGQRTRELALLRAVGAGRRQVMASVLGEAFLTGAFGSVLGLGAGYLLGIGLYSLLKSFLSLESTTMQVLPRTIIVSLVVGTLITLIAAIGPALRASRVPPVAAMQDDFVVPESSLRRRALVGGGVLFVGGGVLGLGLAQQEIKLVGVGAGATFIGVAMLVPFIASPLARLIGLPLLLRGVTGRLGRENSVRSPRRTAATASALMIGIAVVAAIATLSSSALASFTGIFDRSFQASYVVSSNTDNFAAGPVETALRAVPGITALSGFSTLPWHEQQTALAVDGIDPVQGPQVFRIEMVAGSVSSLADGRVLVDDKTAKSDQLKVGDTITMTFATTGDQTMSVGGIYKSNALLGEHYVVATSVVAANSNVVRDTFILVKTANTTTAQQQALNKAIRAFPNLKVQTGAQFKASQQSRAKRSLTFVYLLLGLSIIIALIGVVNTLALSVLERTREIGLLRSIGMFRGQVRAMIRGEAVVVSVLGAVLGLGLGIALGAALVRTLAGSGTGITQLVIPTTTIVVVLLAAGVLGLIAALFPAHRAAKLDVLKAISTV